MIKKIRLPNTKTLKAHFQVMKDNDWEYGDGALSHDLQKKSPQELVDIFRKETKKVLDVFGNLSVRKYKHYILLAVEFPERIVINDCDLGKFKIALRINKTGFTFDIIVDKINYSIPCLLNLSNDPKHNPRDIFPHPHIIGKHLCLGQYQTSTYNHLMNLRLADAMIIIESVLHGYSEINSYRRISMWKEITCPDCRRVYKRELALKQCYHCERCGGIYCKKCMKQICKEHQIGICIKCNRYFSYLQNCRCNRIFMWNKKYTKPTILRSGRPKNVSVPKARRVSNPSRTAVNRTGFLNDTSSAPETGFAA